MKISVLILFLAMITAPVQAQVFKGRILDKSTGEPLQDATVESGRGKRGTHSAEDGRFVLELQPGKQWIEVRHIGYGSIRREITLGDGEEMELELRMMPEVYEQEQVVVTAGKLEMNRDVVPMNITLVSRKELTESSSTNVLPLLSSKVPGMFVTQRGVSGFGLAGGSAGKISIRGVGGTDASFPVLILIDGQPQFMGLMGHPLPDTYVSSDVERVEVVKGPASVLYGTSAMGGAINMITRRQKEEGFSLNGRLSYGSYDTKKGALSGGYRKGGFHAMASLNHDGTDGDRPGSDFRINNGYLSAGFAINDHFSVDANVSQSWFRAYDPGPVSAPFAMKSHWVDISRMSSYLTLSNRHKKSEGGLKAYYMAGDHDIYDGWKSKDHNRGISLYQGWRLFTGNLVSTGIDLKQYGGKGTSPSLGNVSGREMEVSEAGGYLIVQQTVKESLTLNAGLRYDHHSVFGGTWVPQAGASWQAGGHTTLRAMVSKGFRNPTIRDLYLFPPANPDLRPESMWNYEVGIARELPEKRGKIGLTAFWAEGDNLIISAPNPTPPPPFKNQNTGHFSHKGIEAEAGYRISHAVEVEFTYSLLDMDIPKTGVPEQQANVSATYRKGRFDWSLGAEHIRHLYLKTSDLQNLVRNSYLLLNARGSCRIHPKISAFVSGENLLNSDYQMQLGYPMPGATLYTGINFTL